MKKILSAFVWIIFLAPALYIFAIWKTIPAIVPMHYNLEGKVDRYGSKTGLLVMLLILTGVNIAVYLLFTNLHRIDRRRYSPENQDRMHRMAFVISVFISAIVGIIIHTSAKGMTTINFLPGMIFSAVGILLSFLGNYMYNMKSNYFAGFRVSWTLDNEENWKKTHQLAGKLWFAGGLIIAILCLVLPMKAALIIFFVAMAILLIIPVVYSYRLHKKQVVQ